MAEKRNLAEVLDTMIALVPETEAELKAALEWRRGSCNYAAPELEVRDWRKVGQLLQRALGAPPPEWAYPLLREFTGENWPKVCAQLGIEWSEQVNAGMGETNGN